jgi:hypothetical protein
MTGRPLASGAAAVTSLVWPRQPYRWVTVTVVVLTLLRAPLFAVSRKLSVTGGSPLATVGAVNDVVGEPAFRNRTVGPAVWVQAYTSERGGTFESLAVPVNLTLAPDCTVCAGPALTVGGLTWLAGGAAVGVFTVTLTADDAAVVPPMSVMTALSAYEPAATLAQV